MSMPEYSPGLSAHVMFSEGFIYRSETDAVKNLTKRDLKPGQSSNCLFEYKHL